MKKLITLSGMLMLIATSKSQTTYTVNIEPPTDDAYIYAGSPSNNYGSSPNLAVGYAGGSEMKMLIKWDLSSLPNPLSIVNAEIRLYQTTTNSSITTDIYRINSVWSETSVNWNNQPTTIGWYGSQTFSSTSGLKYIPATNLVNDWLTNGNNGVMFKINLGTSYQMFDSKEASSSDPRLIITYISTTGISDFDFNDKIKIFPNPAKDKLIIEFENSKTGKLILLNVFGQEIYNQKISDEKTEIDLSEYNEGIYFLSLQTEEGIFRKKIFVVR